MDMNNMTSSTTIAMQEDAMWADYFAQQAERNARIPAEEAAMWDQYHAEQQMSACPVVSEAEDHEEDTLRYPGRHLRKGVPAGYVRRGLSGALQRPAQAGF